MSELHKSLRDRLSPVARVIMDAGGEIVGRTKLQKTVYLHKTTRGAEKLAQAIPRRSL